MKAYVMINVRTGAVPEVVRQLQQTPGVVEACGTFGTYDAIALVEGQDLQALGHTVTWDIQVIPGVLDTFTCLAIDVT